MANKTSLEKEIAQAEDRILPKDRSDSLQRRLEDYARRFEEGEDDDAPSQYPSELFEPMPETLHKTANTAGLEGGASCASPEDGNANLAQSEAFYTPIDEFKYSEVKPGWTERIEKLPDGSTIRHVSIDLTQIDPDEIDELDQPAWDWQPGPRPPSYRDVERMIKDGY